MKTRLLALLLVALVPAFVRAAMPIGYTDIEPIWDDVATNKCCIQWYDPPADAVKTDVCLVTISGGGYSGVLTDEPLCAQVAKYFTDRGVTCVYLRYRMKKSSLPYFGISLLDARRGIRLIRSQAAKRGFNPNKIGTFSHSAGSHLSVLLATDSKVEQWPEYFNRPGRKGQEEFRDRGDELDQKVSPKTNFALTGAIAYALTDGDGTQNANRGIGASLNPYINLDPANPPAPMCMMHGCNDPWSPIASTLMFRELQKMNVPVEMHLFADQGHGFHGGFKYVRPHDPCAPYERFRERFEEFLHEIGMLGEKKPAIPLTTRFPSEAAGVTVTSQALWEGRPMPGPKASVAVPKLTWSVPSPRKAPLVQVVFVDPASEATATAVRRYLNGKGLAVVTVTGRAEAAVQDLQRAVRLVRAGAAGKGLDADAIGVMGFGVSGRAAYLLATKPETSFYEAADEADKVSGAVQWAFPVGLTAPSASGALTSDDLTFTDTKGIPPIMFLLGSEDRVAAANSVKAWEELRAAGVQSELHTIAGDSRGFWQSCTPETAGATWFQRLLEFFRHEDKTMKRPGFVSLDPTAP